MARTRRRKVLGCALLIALPLVLLGWCLYAFLWPEQSTPQPVLEAKTAGTLFNSAPIAFSPDSTWFCYFDENILVWRNLRGEADHRVPLDHLADEITYTPASSMTFTADGKLILARRFSNVLLMVEAPGGEPKEWRKLTDRPEESPIGVTAAPVGDTIAIVVRYSKLTDTSNMIHEALELFSVSDASVRKVLSEDRANGMRPAKLSLDGRFVAFPDKDGTVKVWHTADGQVAHSIPASLVREVALSADGSRLAYYTDFHERCGLWALPDGRELAEWEIPARATDITFHPDGSLIVACAHQFLMNLPHKGTLWLKNPATGRTKWFRPHDGAINAVAVSPDGQWIATCGGRVHRVKLWRWDQLAP